MSYEIYAVNKGFSTIIAEYPSVFQWLKCNKDLGEQFLKILETWDLFSIREQLELVFSEREDILVCEGLYIFENQFTKVISSMRVEEYCFLLSDLNEFPFLDWLKRSYPTLISIDANHHCGVVK